MKVNQLIEKIKDKWHIKIICFVIAIFLYIFHQVSILERKSFVVPVDLVQNGAVVNVGNVPSSITVSIRAGTDDMTHITSSEIKASIILDNIEEKGTYELPVTINISDRLKEMNPLEIKVYPETVNVTVDRLAVKYISLEPSVYGEVANGYKIESVSVNPSAVEIRGPSSSVDNTDKIYTTKVNVSNAATDFTVEAYYLEIDKRLELDNKGPYRVTMKVVPLPYEKQFRNVNVLPKNLSDNLLLESVIMQIDVTLGGEQPFLESYELPDNAFYVDLVSIKEPGIYDLPVSIKLPGNISVENMSSDRVKVSISERIPEENEENDSEMFIEESVEPENKE